MLKQATAEELKEFETDVGDATVLSAQAAAWAEKALFKPTR